MPFTVHIATVAGTALAPAAKSPLGEHRPPPGTVQQVVVALVVCLGVFSGALFLPLGSRWPRSRWFRGALAGIAGAILIVGSAMALSSCGSGGGGGSATDLQPETPPGTYTLTVTGTAQGASRTAQLTLDVQ
jgi:hypothetical protein